MYQSIKSNKKINLQRKMDNLNLINQNKLNTNQQNSDLIRINYSFSRKSRVCKKTQIITFNTSQKKQG